MPYPDSHEFTISMYGSQVHTNDTMYSNSLLFFLLTLSISRERGEGERERSGKRRKCGKRGEERGV